ncbi:MAG: SdiA-regulated domain-containing protein [Deltaproteobacteria bacterium]|jgi:uncharacterized protein YjiK|nr:SdiA-regulated domain-containing protein [Deltaproteobacteria bacterium]
MVVVSLSIRKWSFLVRPRPILIAALIIFPCQLLFQALFVCDHQEIQPGEFDGIGLANYSLHSGFLEITGVKINASGLTYSKVSHTLLLVTNGPTEINELTLDGKPLRTIQLVGFNDTEGIAHIHGNLYAVIEERGDTIALVTISRSTKKEAKTIRLSDNPGNNKGLERVTYAPIYQRLLAVKERSPRGLYTVLNWNYLNTLPKTEYQKVMPWKC